jgi:spore maturation protein CgeB
LQNPNPGAEQSDLRVRIMEKFFVAPWDVPLFRRKQYSNRRIFWNARPRRKFGQKIARKLRTHRHLNLEEYSSLQANTRTFINTLSPKGLISPRFFENMASRCLVLCEESNLYSNIFKELNLVQFNSDLDDFDELLTHFLEDEKAREAVTKKAYDDVMANHTWEKRVQTLLGVCSDARAAEHHS